MVIRILLVAFVSLFFSCKSSEEKGMEEIKKTEEALYSDQESFKFDEQLARNAIQAYEAFSKEFPKSEKTPDILFKSADLHRALKEYQVALDIYEKVEKDYPDYEKLPHCIFLQGFVYENELFRLEKAKERYETFLKKFPDHELSDDVSFSLQNLGKTPEEIIRQFEQTPAVSDTGSS